MIKVFPLRSIVLTVAASLALAFAAGCGAAAPSGNTTVSSADRLDREHATSRR